MKVYQSVIVLQLAVAVSAVTIPWPKDKIWPEKEEEYEGDPYLIENKGIEKVRNASLLDGDVLMTKETAEILYGENKNEKRGAMVDGAYGFGTLWKGNPPIIPYEISNDLDSEEARIAIEAGISEIREKSCIEFVRRTDEDDYIIFVMDRGCWSFLGQQGGSQPISLSSGCWSKAVVAHELMHALGFLHEQARPDRDQFVDILWENMSPGSERQFQKYDETHIDSRGEKYDYQSVMHYSGNAFSNNGEPTIQRKDDPNLPLGVINSDSGLTESDAIQLNSLYKCGNVPPTDGPEPPTEKPEPSTEKPEPPTDKPEPPTDQPEPSTDKPEPPTDKPEPPTDKPEPPTRPPPPTGIPSILCQKIVEKLQSIIAGLKGIGTSSRRRRSGWDSRRRSGWGSHRRRESGGLFGSRRRRSGWGSSRRRFFGKRDVEEGDNEIHERKKRSVLSDMRHEDVQEKVAQKLANLLVHLDEKDYKSSRDDENDDISPELKEEFIDVLKRYQNSNDEEENSNEDEDNLNEDENIDQDEDIEEKIKELLDDAIDDTVDDIPPIEVPSPTPKTVKPVPLTEKPTPAIEKPTTTTQKPSNSTEKKIPSIEILTTTTTPSVEKPTPATEKTIPTPENITSPTEEPTTSTEQTTRPTEGPTLPTEGPTLPTEGPTLPTEGPSPFTSTLPPTTRSPEIICKDLIDKLKAVIQDLIWSKIGGRGGGIGGIITRRRSFDIHRRRSYSGGARRRNSFGLSTRRGFGWGDAKGGLIEEKVADENGKKIENVERYHSTKKDAVSSKSDTKNKKLSDNIERIFAQLNDDDDEEDLD